MLGWTGSFLGVAGAVLLSLNISLSPWGYVLFMGSSLILSLWAYRAGLKHQLIMQAVFSVINANGIVNWLL